MVCEHIAQWRKSISKYAFHPTSHINPYTYTAEDDPIASHKYI